MIINLGERFYSHDIDRPDSKTCLAHSFVAGLHERHALIGSGGNALCLQIDMTPLAARRLFGVPMQHLRGNIVTLDDLPWTDALRLTERLVDLVDWRSALRAARPSAARADWQRRRRARPSSTWRFDGS